MMSVFFTSAATGAWTGDEYETGVDGAYSAELPPGSYFMIFASEFGSHTSVFWDGATRWDESTPIVVTADQTTVVDMVMDAGGSTISGVATDGTGTPLEGISVFAVHQHPDFDHNSLPKASFGLGVTEADGSYTVNGLPDGDYWVLAATVAPVAWHGASSYTGDPVADGATIVSLTGSAANIDVTIDSAAIAGWALDSYDGAALEGICVDVVDAGDQTTVRGSAVTDDEGLYTIGGITDQPFHVRLTDCSRDVYVTEWVGAPNPDDPDGAAEIQLDAGEFDFFFGDLSLRLTDIDGSVFRNDIIWLAGEAITTGCNAEKTLFCPGDSVTRGQMAAFLVRALGLTDIDPTIDYDDDDLSIFETDIAKLATAEVTTGCGGNDFCPLDPVTRGQMAAFLVRALGLTAIDPTIDFDDDDASPFETDIAKLATAGITSGCGGNNFCPSQPVTRGQMAAFLKRALTN